MKATQKRRALSFVLTLAMLFSMAMPTAFAAEVVTTAEKAYSDIAGHWAEKPIERWDEYGIVSGFGEEFRPNGTITRGQMASILSNLLNLTEEAENTFSDVTEGKWYTTFVLRCVKAGIMAGANGKAMPEKEITRQEAMTMLCQALGIEPKADADLSKYSDVDQMARWAKPFVGALVEAGIVSGVSADKLGATSSMSRGAVMTVLDKAVVQYINKPGTYELIDAEGIVLVAADNVKLTGETKADVLVSPAINEKTVSREEVAVGGGGGGSSRPSRPSTPSTPTVTDLVVPTAGAVVTGGTYADVTIADSVEDGEVTLENMTINGDLIVEGGGSGTIKVHNCYIKGKIVMKKDGGEHPRVHLHDTPAPHIVVEKPAIIEADDQRSPIGKVEAKDNVVIKGENTKVETVEVSEAVSSVAIEVQAGKVEQIEVKSKTTVTGGENTVGEVVAEAPVSVDSTAVDKVQVPETATTRVAIEVTGNGNVAVEVNTENGADITAENADVQVSTELASAPTVTVNSEPVEHFHVWSEGVVNPAATCTQAGIKTYTCTAEGCTDLAATKVENIAKLNHKEVEDKAVAATCTQSGLTMGYHCEDCGAVTKVQNTVEALGHTEVVDEAKAPTCEETGLTEGTHCSVCNEVLVVQEEVAVLGHNWDNGVVTEEATLHETGIKMYTCGTCGETKEEVIPVIELMGKNGYELNVHLGSDLFTEVIAPEGTDPNTRYTFMFYNSYNPNIMESWGDREANATYGIPSSVGSYDVFQLSIYDGDFEDNEIVAEFFLDTPIAVYDDAFTIEENSITVTRTPNEDDENRAWYDIEGLNFDEYGYYFAADVDDYPNPMGTPPLGLSKDYCDTTMVIYASYAYEDTLANLYIKSISEPYVATIIDKALEDLDDEALIEAANDIDLLEYISSDIDLDAQATRLEVAQLIASLDSLILESNVTLDYTDCGDLSEQEKAIIMANVDAGYLAGRQDGTFVPGGTITRAEVAMILQQIYEINGMQYPIGALDDVVPGIWYYEAVMNFYNLGIIQLDGRIFEPTANITMRDIVEWCVNAREWDETPHDLGGVTDWQKVASEHVHAKICVDCGLWVEKEYHSWNDGVLNADETQITKTCTVCGFEWTEDYAGATAQVSNVRFERNSDSIMCIVWDNPTDMTGIDHFNVVTLDENDEEIHSVEVSVEGEPTVDVPNLGGPTGTYTVQIVSVPTSESGMVESTVDTGLSLTVTRGASDIATHQAVFTKEEENAYIFRCDSINTLVTNGHYNLALSIMEGDQRVEVGGHAFKLGTRDKLIDGRDLDNVIANGQYRIQSFVYELSQDEMNCTFTVSNLSEWIDCTSDESDDTITGIITTGEYPVSNIRFEGKYLMWDAPQNVPEDAAVSYAVETSAAGAAEWENFSNTSQTLINIFWANPGTYNVRVITMINKVENGTATDGDCKLIINQGTLLENVSASFEYLRTENEQDFYNIQLSGLTDGSYYWMSLTDADGNSSSGFGGTYYSTSTGNECGASGLKNIVETGTYHLFVYNTPTVSEDGKTMEYTYDYTGSAKCTPEDTEVVWSAAGVVTWSAVDGATRYRVSVYEGNEAAGTTVLTRIPTATRYAMNNTVMSLTGEESTTYSIKVEALDSSSNVISEVGRLDGAIAVTVSGDKAEYSFTVAEDGITYTMSFAEGTPDGLRALFWNESEYNVLSDYSGDSTYTRTNTFVDGDVAALRIFTTNRLNEDGTVWNVTLTPTSEKAYTAPVIAE